MVGHRGTLLQRLPMVTNNYRFLLLPDMNVPNLAFRMLSVNLKRLSHDWREADGHSICLAEAFADPLFLCVEAPATGPQGGSLSETGAGLPIATERAPITGASNQYLSVPFA